MLSTVVKTKPNTQRWHWNLWKSELEKWIFWAFSLLFAWQILKDMSRFQHTDEKITLNNLNWIRNDKTLFFWYLEEMEVVSAVISLVMFSTCPFFDNLKKKKEFFDAINLIWILMHWVSVFNLQMESSCVFN